jgi:RNA ligase
MTHPARLCNFDHLKHNLEAACDASLVHKQTHDDLSVYCYTKECVIQGAWDDTTTLARGLVLSADRVVATPFPKFFNYHETPNSVPDLPFEVYEKVDGSLIIIFNHNGRWMCCTKGSFESDQARWAQRILDDESLPVKHLDPDSTYLCEAVYPENRIVIQYDYSGLVMLGGYDDSGRELTRQEIVSTALVLGWKVADMVFYRKISDLLEAAKTLPPDEEGWVLRFSNGLRLKIKGEEYLKLHRMISKLSPLTIWEAMRNGTDLQAFRNDLPEEFHGDFDRMFNIIWNQVQCLVYDTRKAVQDADGQVGHKLSDKEVGLMLQAGKFPKHVQRFIFPYRHQQENIITGRSRTALFNAVRPTGNRLLGYTPSQGINRVQQES